MLTASLVTISRLKGYSYAVESEENKLFAEFFNSEQSLTVGQFLYVVDEPYKSFQSNHRVKLLRIYPYLVNSVKACPNSESSSHNVQVARTSNSITRVMLSDTSSIDALSPCHHISNCIREMWSHREFLSTVSYCFTLRGSLSSQPLFLDANLTSEELEHHLTEYLKVEIDSNDDELYRSFIPKLLGTGRRCESILLDSKDSSMSLLDMRNKLEFLALNFGASFIEVESKLLLIQNSRLHSLSLHNDDRGLPLQHRLTNHSADSIINFHRHSSIVFIDDFDSVLSSSHEQGAVSAAHASSLEDLLLESIHTLQDDLNNSLSTIPQQIGPVLIIAFTSCRSRWKASSLRTFSSHLSLTSTTSTAKDHHQQLSAPYQLSTGAISELKRIEQESAISTRERDVLINQAAALAMQREQRSQWIYTLAMDQLLPVDASDYVSLKRDRGGLSCASAAGTEEESHSSQSQPLLTVRKKDIKNALKQSKHILFSSYSQSSSGSSNHVAAVRWEDIGGLDRVRQEILDVLELPKLHPELFTKGAPMRQGVLLYGPPGTGKTLVAKAVATECNMSFLSIKGPELLDSYVGESEKNVRDIFDRARAQAPCVLFFDEVDSLAPARAKRNDSGGGVMDRIVSQLLTEMDQLFSRHHHDNHEDNVHNSMVFIIAATNRPDLLDPALLRPGRFDRRIYLGVSNDITARINILKAQTRKFSFAPDVDLTAVAERLPSQVTGADIGAVTTSAYQLALQRKLVNLRLEFYYKVSSKNSGNGDSVSVSDGMMVVESQEDMWALTEYIDQLPKNELQVVVEQADFFAACDGLTPSVFDLAHYENLQSKYES